MRFLCAECREIKIRVIAVDFRNHLIERSKHFSHSVEVNG